MTKRIRIFFIGCPSLDTDAASHLLLSQNTIQRAVQFEIYHFWIYGIKAHGLPSGRIQSFLNRYGNSSLPFSRWCDRRVRSAIDYREAPLFRSPLAHDKWFATCEQAVRNFDSWLKTKDTYDVTECPTIIITETPIEGGFISFTNDNIGLISTAKWNSFFKPVSALDYLLFSTQRLTMRLAFTKQVGSHYPTRGCLWDYDDHQPDARIAILLGHICHTCKTKLLDAAGEEVCEELAKLVENKWLGDKSVQFSTASILASVHRYDLSRSTGLNTSFYTRIKDSLGSELGKVISEAIKWALVLIITLAVAAYFPTVLSKIKQQLQTGQLKGTEVVK